MGDFDVQGPGSGARRVCTTLRALIYLLILAFGVAPACAADGVFIPAAGRIDYADDAAHHLLYIGTSAGSILRYDTSSQAFLTPIQISGSYPMGMDLSPDGSHLLFADGNGYNATQSWFHDLNLTTGVDTPVAFTNSSANELTTYSVAYGADGRALVTTEFVGSGLVKLRRYDPSDGSVTVLGDIFQNAVLMPSADRSAIAIAADNISPGAFGRYRTSDGDIRFAPALNASLNQIGVDRNASHYAVPSGLGTLIYDQNFNLLGTIGQDGGPRPTSVVYSPNSDVLYATWLDSSLVKVFDATSLAELRSFQTDQPFNIFNANHRFDDGWLRTSPDGSLLFVGVDNGVRMITVPEPATGTLPLFGSVMLALRRRHGLGRRRAS